MNRTRPLALAALAALVGCAADRDDSIRVSVTYATTTSVDAATSTATATSTTLGDPSGEVALRVVADDLERPVDIDWRTDDPAMFVVEQAGRVLRIDATGTTIVLDMQDDVNDGGGEQGLLGLAFHPSQERAYLNYILERGATRIAEFEIAADGTFDRSSERTILEVEQPFPNHNGGSLAFGPDGLLYIALGDGGSAGDPRRTALDPTSLLGKVLRIDPTPNDDAPYSVPPDNPFVDVDGARPEIWASGLRNPWRFSFDPASGDMWLGDVGQGEWEEVDHAPATDGRNAGRAVNFGWSAFEGTTPYNADQPTDGVTMPVHVYPHDGRCSVTGGAVYRGTSIPSLRGWYVFSDYCDGVLRALHPGDPTSTTTPVVLGGEGTVVAIDAAPDGELYVLDLDAGTVSRLVAA